MWQKWRPVFGWSNLCPIIAADPFGLIVVMRRAKQPVTQEEVDAADPNDYPAITAECKAEDYGLVEDCVVALDYGLPDESMIQEKRAYFQEMAESRGLVGP